MCALSASQANKGALFTNDTNGTNEPRSAPITSSVASEFLDEAIQLTPLTYQYHGGGSEGGISLLRCYGILSLIGTQTGDAQLLHRYLGLYHGLSAQIGLHNEERWPAAMPGTASVAALSLCERETRRRIFWVVYRIEVHNACVLGHPIRTPESQTYVQYPCGVHHPLTFLFPNRNGKFENWMAGWNYTTELYRILEHAIVDFRSKRTMHTTVLWRTEQTTSSRSGSGSESRSTAILQQLQKMQSNLLPQFAQAAMKSSDSGSNRSGFQVANILCTIHLVKMVVLASENGRFVEVCQNVQDLVDSMGTVPRDYIRAFGTPVMQELLGVGFMLTSMASRDHSLSDEDHFRLKAVM
ncbi:uncharacterized protein SPSK_00041 [Sporothrix schenckii 1099-18]|uniref:Xylanolytic transcriptional activator regulatory domain-containing protein n=2 Tax=Sporothrix schenckii TaxID=29908 RepID=U7PNU4_SPOS1|nr:uncharacterized protein SPSK_00041 [Sporothrix schenckii 1099-18]ERS96170.1 hypothetical protein HMPREF1624_07706 [Sporothrix schenckii ATCC 58251]KJR79801.1 hypothetical protein SPSK_00041 [Sporothrix schenckii 1099-18]